jgi:thioredoxin reductase
MVVDRAAATDPHEHETLAEHGIKIVDGRPRSLTGDGGRLRAVQLDDGSSIECDLMFCTIGHLPHSDLSRRLGCEVSGEGCVVVDDQCRTSVEHVYAAGDITPGPHLVQIAAAKGATAGIAAAVSLRGTPGSPLSPRPAPDPAAVLG